MKKLILVIVVLFIATSAFAISETPNKETLQLKEVLLKERLLRLQAEFELSKIQLGQVEQDLQKVIEEEKKDIK